MSPTAIVDDQERTFELPAGYDPEKCVLVSSTQLETFAGGKESCKRKWWLQWPMKAPKLEPGYLTFGTVTHAVVERFLNADDLGRGEDGKPVDLYPEGWHQGLAPVEADLIQKLVAKAIEEGIIARLPGRKIEQKYVRHLVKHGEIDVFAVGFIDVLLPDAVHDHKTTKSMKWAKSPAAIQKNTQMLLYAMHAFETAHEEGRELETLTVRHNVFCKDPTKPKVRATEAKVTLEQVFDHWIKCQELAREMVDLRQQYTNLNQWAELPDPVNFAAACNAYKGCPYRPICAKREKPEPFFQRIEKLILQQTQQAEGKKEIKLVTMTSTFKEKVAAKANAGKVPPATTGTPAVNGTPAVFSAASAPPPKAAPAKPPAKKEKEKQFWHGEPPELKPASAIQFLAMSGDEDFELCADGDEDWKTATAYGFKLKSELDAEAASMPKATAAPPWTANDGKGCTACTAHPGFNSKGRPCPVCDSQALKAGRKPSAGFKQITDGSGVLQWVPIEEGEAGAAPIPNAASEPTTETVEEPEAPATEETPAPEAPAAEAPKRGPGRPRKTAPPAADGTTPAPTKASPGRPKQGFVLCLGCAPLKAPKVVQLHEVFDRVTKAIAEASGAASFYDLETWPRRDALAKAAAVEAEGLTGCHVVAIGSSPDLRHFVDALTPFAGVIVAVTSAAI